MVRIAAIAFAAVLVGGCGSTLYGVGTVDDALSSIETSGGVTTRIGPLDPAATGPSASQGKFDYPAAMSLRPRDNALFVWNNIGIPSGTTDRVLAIVDRCTGRAAEVAQTSSPPQEVISALAFAPDGKLFGFGRRTSFGPVYLYEIDQANGSQRAVGQVTGTGGSTSWVTDVTGAEFNPSGALYAVAHSRLLLTPGSNIYVSRLLVVDPQSAAASVVGQFNVVVGTPGSIAFTSSGTLVGSGSGGPSGNVLFDIDPSSAAITNVRVLSGSPMHGLVFGPSRDECVGTPGLPWRLVAGSVNHVCALATDGRAFCWGENLNGKLGDASWTDRNVPTEVHDQSGATPSLSYQRISAGGSHTCGIATDGTTYCWGSNGRGELGTGGSPFGSSYPATVAAPEPFAEIASGGSHTCALSTNGKAYCWGFNQYGQLGNGGTVDAATPVSVSEPYAGAVFKIISAGQGHTCGITTTDVTYCWGWNEYGQLGDGNGGVGVRQTMPVHVMGGHKFVSLSAGMFHTCGVTDNGTALCWGNNRSGGLGFVSADTCSSEPCGKLPGVVSGSIQFAVVNAGANHTCGTTRSGIAYCWGTGTTGQVGSGEVLPDCPAAERCTYVPLPVFGGRAYASIAAAQGATCAVDLGGIAYCWGGQPNMLGTGETNLVSYQPLVVSSP